MHRKSEIFDNFQEFRVEVKKQLCLSIKTLQFDRGEEYFK